MKQIIATISARELREKLKIEDGKTPVKGVDYFDGVPGVNGLPGKDGSPDTGKEIVVKVNGLPIQPEFQIDASHIKNLPKATKNKRGGGGADPVIIQDEGTRVTTTPVNTINFIGAGVVATHLGNGVIAVTIAGATTNFADNETPSGIINGVMDGAGVITGNTIFTLAQTPSPATSLQLYLNGAIQKPAGGDFTLAGATITFNNAPLAGSILTAYYRYA